MVKQTFQTLCNQGKLSLFVGACVLPLMMGCPQGGEFREMGAKDDVTNTHDHGHHHEHGPHDGHIIELGDYHGEVTMGADRVFTLYILGSDAKTAAPISDATAKLHAQVGSEKKEILLTSAPLEGEADGKTSRFTAAADAVPVEIIDIEDLKGEVVLIIAGKETVAQLAHDHGHDHDHDKKPAEAPAAK